MWPFAFPLQHAAIVAVGGPRAEGERRHLLPMDVRLHLFSPIHAQIARLYPHVNRRMGEGGASCQLPW